jgi:LysM repeat protein
MKHIRISPWLIVILAAVTILAAGCNRPDPQVAIDTPQSSNLPSQPLTGGTLEPGAAATLAAGGATLEPGAAATLAAGVSTLAPGEATPTLPPPLVPTKESPAGQETPQLVPTVPPPQPTQSPAQPTPQVQPTAQVNAQGNVVHTVKPGETLFSIGRLYNVNPYSIAAANNVPYPYIIYPGQQLTIPTAGTTPPGPTPVPPQSGQCRYYHMVLPGENLYRISLAYGVPMATIAAANGIVNYNLIYAGQTLCIP